MYYKRSNLQSLYGHRQCKQASQKLYKFSSEYAYILKVYKYHSICVRNGQYPHHFLINIQPEKIDHWDTGSHKVIVCAIKNEHDKIMSWQSNQKIKQSLVYSFFLLLHISYLVLKNRNLLIPETSRKK